MKVFIVFCHPGKISFTHSILNSFIFGLKSAGHDYVISDLYDMKFKTDISEIEYFKETNYRAEIPVSEDIMKEQNKIQGCNAIVFIYPVFWTEAPAKLVGWFDRVWTTGYAYNPNPTMKMLDKALFLVCAGKTLESLEETGEKAAMETVMLGDRFRNRARNKEMIIFDGITHWNEEQRNEKIPKHLAEVFEIGRGL
ncbi:MAG: NAD(P)H-dependent oxidoreductase [Lachnotalea sp.]